MEARQARIQIAKLLTGIATFKTALDALEGMLKSDQLGLSDRPKPNMRPPISHAMRHELFELIKTEDKEAFAAGWDAIYEALAKRKRENPGENRYIWLPDEDAGGVKTFSNSVQRFLAGQNLPTYRDQKRAL